MIDESGIRLLNYNVRDLRSFFNILEYSWRRRCSLKDDEILCSQDPLMVFFPALTKLRHGESPRGFLPLVEWRLTSSFLPTSSHPVGV